MRKVIHRLASIHFSGVSFKAVSYRSWSNRLLVRLSVQSKRGAEITYVYIKTEIPTGVQCEPDWRSLPFSLLLFILLLQLHHVQERLLDPRCYFYWLKYRRSVRPPSALQVPLVMRLIAGQTHRYCMYTSFDVFQTVSKGQNFHKTHGEPFSGYAIQ